MHNAARERRVECRHGVLRQETRRSVLLRQNPRHPPSPCADKTADAPRTRHHLRRRNGDSIWVPLVSPYKVLKIIGKHPRRQASCRQPSWVARSVSMSTSRGRFTHCVVVLFGSLDHFHVYLPHDCRTCIPHGMLRGDPRQSP